MVRDPPGQRTPGRRYPLDRDPPGQRLSLERDSPSTGTPPDGTNLPAKVCTDTAIIMLINYIFERNISSANFNTGKDFIRS